MGNIPDYYLGQEVDWPHKSRDLKTRVTYTCPFRMSTWDDNLVGKSLHSLLKGSIRITGFSEQYSTCIWDKDTDQMVWWPPEIVNCNRKRLLLLHFF